MRFRFTLNEKNCPPKLGKNLPETRKLRTGDVDANLMAKALGRLELLITFSPPGIVQKPSAKNTVLFFFGGKIYKFSKRFQKLLKKRIGKKFGGNGLVITLEEVFNWDVFDFFCVNADSRVCLTCMTSEITF